MRYESILSMVCQVTISGLLSSLRGRHIGLGIDELGRSKPAPGIGIVFGIILANSYCLAKPSGHTLRQKL